jgi:7 transmembrane receptor (rhodopsin family)
MMTDTYTISTIVRDTVDMDDTDNKVDPLADLSDEDMSRLCADANKPFLNGLSKTFAALSVVANAVSLLAIVMGCRGGSTSTNLRLICSLSAADILAGLCGVLTDHRVTPIVGDDQYACANLVGHNLRIAAHLLVLCSLMGLAVDHYLAICRPLYHLKQLAAVRMNVVIAAIWMFSVVCSFSDVMVAVSDRNFSTAMDLNSHCRCSKVLKIQTIAGPNHS